MEKSGSLTISHNWIFIFIFFIYQKSKFASFQSDEGLYMHFKTQGLEVNPFTHTHTHYRTTKHNCWHKPSWICVFTAFVQNSNPTIWESQLWSRLQTGPGVHLPVFCRPILTSLCELEPLFPALSWQEGHLPLLSPICFKFPTDLSRSEPVHVSSPSPRNQSARSILASTRNFFPLKTTNLSGYFLFSIPVSGKRWAICAGPCPPFSAIIMMLSFNFSELSWRSLWA